MEKVSEKRWRLRESDTAAVTRLTGQGGIPPLVARLLVNRGVDTPEMASLYLAASLGDLHDPLLLRGMEQAVDRLFRAACTGDRVCVYGDYDVDGITAVALLIQFFRSVGIDCFYHIPKRLEGGYGLSPEGIAETVARGAKVIVTVDCGVTAVAEARLCQDLGVDLIITDHHMPGDTIPDALALINPLQTGCSFPFKYPAGVGVAFNLVMALRSRLRAEGWFRGKKEPDIREGLDLVALGTIADMVPLVDENRIFVRYGLMALSASTRPGIKALKSVAGVTGSVGSGTVGFRLAPRLNAAGRLENAALGVELLLTSDPAQARTMAEELDASNAARQSLEQEILREALAMVGCSPGNAERKSIVLASESWHPGVIGIVASRIVELYHRPTVLIALQEGNGRGSCRSIPGLHLHEALRACSEHLVKFGGHKYAAGLSIVEAALPSFVAGFEETVAGLLSPDDLVPVLSLDAELRPGELTLPLAESVKTLGPFGTGNPEPLFVLRGAQIVDQRVLKENHLRLRLRAGGELFEAIGFNLAHKGGKAGEVDVAFSLDADCWNGRSRLQLRLKDIRETGQGELRP